VLGLFEENQVDSFSMEGLLNGVCAVVGKVTLKSNGNNALSDESL
jgi:hypothetical protein